MHVYTRPCAAGAGWSGARGAGLGAFGEVCPAPAQRVPCLCLLCTTICLAHPLVFFVARHHPRVAAAPSPCAPRATACNPRSPHPHARAAAACTQRAPRRRALAARCRPRFCWHRADRAPHCRCVRVCAVLLCARLRACTHVRLCLVSVPRERAACACGVRACVRASVSICVCVRTFGGARAPTQLVNGWWHARVRRIFSRAIFAPAQAKVTVCPSSTCRTPCCKT
jgi:hypothetical protein